MPYFVDITLRASFEVPTDDDDQVVPLAIALTDLARRKAGEHFRLIDMVLRDGSADK